MWFSCYQLNKACFVITVLCPDSQKCICLFPGNWSLKVVLWASPSCVLVSRPYSQHQAPLLPQAFTHFLLQTYPSNFMFLLRQEPTFGQSILLHLYFWTHPPQGVSCLAIMIISPRYLSHNSILNQMLVILYLGNYCERNWSSLSFFIWTFAIEKINQESQMQRREKQCWTWKKVIFNNLMSENWIHGRRYGAIRLKQSHSIQIRDQVHTLTSLGQMENQHTKKLNYTMEAIEQNN